MTATNHDRLYRILQLALSSPYEGERQKAVTLFLGLLEKSELSLHQLDRSFVPGDGAHELRKRVGLPVRTVFCVKSHEEAILYSHLVQRVSGPEVMPQTTEVSDGYEVTCTLNSAAQHQTQQAFAAARKDLSGQLAAAQQQALSEYQTRRRFLFEEAIQALAATMVFE